MSQGTFIKSDMGAQAAWKGFSSQTLYIASRVICDEQNCEFYPEDIEDLIIKKEGVVIEAVQVKNITAPLTLSSLSSTDTSKSGEGFFKRMCSLHKENTAFCCIKVVHFNSLGQELMQLEKNNAVVKKNLIERLVEKHTLDLDEATWLINSLCFEKVDANDLDAGIQDQINEYVPVMAAPILAKELLIQYISKLSNSKGFTTLNIWKEKIHNIGVDIAALDGFYKEYNKSIVCLSELNRNADYESLKYEFSQGISAHPMHIRYDFDFKRDIWMREIHEKLKDKGAVLIKGVSGQGKSTLSYRYLIDSYPEGCVFCVRSISTEDQAYNLVSAIDGLGKHNENIIIYIDVQPGETLWPVLLQELQARGLNVPVLISIRDEDFNATTINGKSITYGVVNLTLSKEEAENIYTKVTEEQPHAIYRTFEEAWSVFGGDGPLIEFVYMLTNNQTLTQKLSQQIDALIQENVSDEWLDVLEMVCYVGRLGCSVDFVSVKEITQCSTMNAAIRRFKDEYLIRLTEDNKLEALHPVRAKIVYEILCNQICTDIKTLLVKVLSCISPSSVWVVLLDYFSVHEYDINDVKKLTEVVFKDWQGYASGIKAMLWLDVKHYAEINKAAFDTLIQEKGKGWLCFLPLDFANVKDKDELIVDSMKELSIFNLEQLQESIDAVKKSLTSLHITYEATDYFLENSNIPDVLPDNDENRSLFGYSLFWMAQRGICVNLKHDSSEIVNHVCVGEIQASADAIRGLFEQEQMQESYNKAVSFIEERLISEMNVIFYTVNDDEVVCKFVPPFLMGRNTKDNNSNTNQYWRIKMLDILKQIYPEKEYIDIELVGVDFLKDIGIEPLDHKLRIHKNQRYDSWASEVNGWLKTRIEYDLRPESWDKYVLEIDEIRINVHELINDTLKLIDDLYKKGRFTPLRANKVDEKIKIFRQHTFAENRLPSMAVDSYCLYSEGNAKRQVKEDEQQNLEEMFPMRQLLSVGKYEKFRKGLNDVYTSLDNFYNQYLEVLKARINGNKLDIIENPKLAMYNLYSAAKALPEFQKEYEKLFTQYSSLEQNFAKNEIDSLLTLVNVWRYVLDNPPKGVAIVYDAKQRYKRGTKYFRDTIESSMHEMNAKLIEGEEYIYIAADYELSEDNTIESEYKKIVLILREIFSGAILPSSNRWYVECQPLKFAYVPVISGAYLPIAYSIPYYHIFDSDIDSVANSMFVCNVEPALEKEIYIGENRNVWVDSIKQLNVIKIYLLQYQQLLQVPIDEKCENVYLSIKENFICKIKESWTTFYLSRTIANQLQESVEEMTKKLISVLNSFYDSFGYIETLISENTHPDKLILDIDNAMEIMYILLPVV